MRNALKTHCKHGHELTPENTWIGETMSRSRNGKVYKSISRACKTCISNRKRLRYQTNEQFRARAIAYNRWWRNGDPEGRQWPEIKAEIVS